MKLGTFQFRMAFVLILGFTGCGGSGGGSSSTPVSPAPASPVVTGTAEGVYSGTTSNGHSFDGIVLEDGTYYVLYGLRSAGTLFVSGFSQGNGTSNNGSFTSANFKDYFANGTVLTGTVSASYGVNSSFYGTISEGGATATFTGTTPANTAYVYNTAANPGDIAGAWTLTDMKGGTLAISISTTGSFTGTYANGCSFNGTFIPRASGKNVFNMSITFGAAPCALPGQTASGIAIDYLLPNGMRQFIAGGVDNTRTLGTSVFGTR